MIGVDRAGDVEHLLTELWRLRYRNRFRHAEPGWKMFATSTVQLPAEVKRRAGLPDSGSHAELGLVVAARLIRAQSRCACRTSFVHLASVPCCEARRVPASS